LRSWRRIDSRRVQRCGIFDLEQVRFRPPDDAPPRSFYVIDAPDWINVIPLTEEQQVLMVRQYRFGIEEFTLEIPGGMCDAGELPARAARRELREETGYEAAELIDLGWVHPNPPVQNNRCHSFLARRLARVAEPDLDLDERIEQVSVPLAEIPRLIADRTISHALVLAAFRLFELSDAAK
jgi:8-oxo-dGTP pyrophosphatase MutT (NUDIX family)